MIDDDASASLAFELAVLERMDPRYRAGLLREIGLTPDEAHSRAARSPIRLPEQTDSSIDVYRAVLGTEVLTLDPVRPGPEPGDASVPHCFVVPLWPHLFWVVEQFPDGQTWNVGFRNQIALSFLHFTPARVRPGVWTRSALESLVKSVEWGEGWDETSAMRFTIGHQRYEGVFTYGLLTAWRCLTP